MGGSFAGLQRLPHRDDRRWHFRCSLVGRVLPVTPPGQKITDVTPLFQIDDGRLLNQLAVWAPDAAIRKKILVDNPGRLYGFG